MGDSQKTHDFWVVEYDFYQQSFSTNHISIALQCGQRGMRMGQPVTTSVVGVAASHEEATLLMYELMTQAPAYLAARPDRREELVQRGYLPPEDHH